MIYPENHIPASDLPVSVIIVITFTLPMFVIHQGSTTLGIYAHNDRGVPDLSPSIAFCGPYCEGFTGTNVCKLWATKSEISNKWIRVAGKYATHAESDNIEVEMLNKVM